MANIGERLVFGEFQLDLRARELQRNGERVGLAMVAFDSLAYLIQHRDRPVGRDELISAVWGRAEISESTLAHTVVRLRQVLGDSGNDQHSIRTVPRFGYRWVAPVEVVEAAAVEQPPEVGTSLEEPTAADEATADEAASDEKESERPERDSSAVQAVSRQRWRRPAIAATVVVAVLFTTLIAIKPWRDNAPAPSITATTAMQAALVVPAEVTAPEQWTWLRLGLMDLVANRLRESGWPTVPSETAVSLASRPVAASAAAQEMPNGISLRILPRVSLIGENWRVTLQALGADGQRMEVEADGHDAMTAARNAADKLLTALGHSSPLTGDQPSSELAGFLQQIAAARLANRLPQAVSLLEKAPAQWKASPEVQLVAARIDCDRGERQSCQRRLDALKDRIPAQKQPVLYGRWALSQAWLHINRGELSQGSLLLDEIIGLDKDWGASDVLGNAYSLRGWLRNTQERLDEAAADLGQARTIFLRSGNLRELARVDQRLGNVADRRGQLASAQALLQAADQQFSNLGASGDQLVTLMSLVSVQEQLLQFEEALATTDRFWSEGRAHDWGAALFRAWALIGNGRLKEAETIIAHALAGSDPAEQPWIQPEAESLSAHVALLRGQNAQAIRLARLAKSSELEEFDRRDYLGNWVVLIQALRGSGRVTEAAEETDALQKWIAGFRDDRLLVVAVLTQAEQAWLEGRREQATQAYEQAMAYADRIGVPEVTVAVASSYATALIESGQLEQAGAVNGRLAAWTNHDMRAAWVHARLLRALGNAPAAEAAFRTATRLAGERRLKPIPGVGEDG